MGNSNKTIKIHQRIIGKHRKIIANPPSLPASKAPTVMKIGPKASEIIKNGPWNNDNSDVRGRLVFAIPLTPSPCSLCPRRPDSERKKRTNIIPRNKHRKKTLSDFGKANICIFEIWVLIKTTNNCDFQMLVLRHKRICVTLKLWF